MIQLKVSSPAEVIEGESYSVRLTVTNQSMRAGNPVEATLKVGISASTEVVSLIPEQKRSEYFAPGETRAFEYPMIIPMDSGGQSGQIIAWVESPTGLYLASATEDITIVSVAKARFYMPAKMEVKAEEHNGLYTLTFSLAITNKGDAPGTYQIVWGSNYITGEYEEEASRIITLNPGETHHWSWVYSDIEYYYRDFFTCWLFGDWEGDNSSVGVWK